MNRMIRTMLSTVVAVAVLLPMAAVAQETEPTPAPKAKTIEKKRPKTLADLAGGMKLKAPEDLKEDGSVVIDNSNLKEMGEGAVVSESKNLAGNSGRSPLFDRNTEGDEVPTAADLDKARQDIELLKAQIEATKELAEKTKKANLYQGTGAHYRPGGVTDPVDDQSEELQQQLKEAESAFAKMQKKKAAAAGSASSDAPAPKPPEGRRKLATR